MTVTSKKPFRFKQFSIHQDRCAMKVGTDGVLLGAWTSCNDNPETLLDIGTGTGVIALMLAQRSEIPTIDALELDDQTYEQATENFENSDWADRLFCYHAHLYEFAAQTDDTYDLIVCNPPYFPYTLNDESKGLLRQRSQRDGASQKAREQARLDDTMPFELLVGAVAKLLSAQGTFNVIIPFDREDDFTLLCSRAQLFPTRITRVQGSPTATVKRSLMEFRFFDSEERFRESENTSITNLMIEESRHTYTQDYRTLVKDFYLKM